MGGNEETWGSISGLNVTYLQRWASAWADLLFADMALLEHGELPDKPSTVLHRRALWESAVVSYGRVAVSDHKRPIEYVELVDEVLGKEGVALHERVMDWRHGHVAHRKRAEFESISTVIAYQAPPIPSALRSVLNVEAGPQAQSEFARAFQRHIESMRNAMYELRIRPLALAIIDDLNDGRIAKPSALRPADAQSTKDRYIINHCLLELGASFT